jgi:nitrogen fixation/metabolism regulation signal transduction histidine kinase
VDRGRLIRGVLAALPVLALLALLFGALLLAGDAETDETRLGRWSPWLFGGALAAVVVLLVTIARQLWRLARHWRERAPGARLAGRWTLALVLLAVPPVILVYGFALRFLNSTIDSWFNVRVETALNDALALGRIYLDDARERARASATTLADELAALPREAWAERVDAALDTSGALALAAFADNGAVLASAAADARLLLPTPPDAATLLAAREGGTDVQVEPLGEELAIRAIAPLGSDAVLVATSGLPGEVQGLARSIESSWHDYQRLDFLRGSLKLTFTLILSAVLLLSLLLAVLAALRVARRQAAPVAALARATADVAAGAYGRELPPAGDDELGFLTDSFNRMTRELDAASRATRASQAETERQRAYLETVLARLSSGVLAWDDTGVLRTGNRAAAAILGLEPAALREQALSALASTYPALAPLTTLLAARAREGAREWREELRLAREDGSQVLVLRAAELPAGDVAAPRQFVVVFDDQTALNQAQREAAWGEVARRLAHEVKNPLTPIQLSAERVKHRLTGRLGNDDAQMVAKATQTIVAQVEALKSLVNAFGDYARPPQLRLQPVHLNAVVGEVLDLYEQAHQPALTRALDASDPVLRADPDRLRQLLHNLVKNALEASGESATLEVATRVHANGDARQVELVVADRGTGLPEGFDDTWFEPYRTSKARGTGLGLAIVRKVAEELGGHVRAEQREGGGARFTVALPL